MAASAAPSQTISAGARRGCSSSPTPPDHIVIETSGLALPKPLVQALRLARGAARVTVDGVVAVIDAAALVAGKRRHVRGAPRSARRRLHDDPLDEVFGDQLAGAELVILNKVDLVEGAALDAAEAALAARLRPGVRSSAPRTADPASVAPRARRRREDELAARPSRRDIAGEHDHDDFESFVIARGPVGDPPLSAPARRGDRAHGILRLKGFLDVPGKGLPPGRPGRRAGRSAFRTAVGGG